MRADRIALITLIPIPGSGNKLPDSGHQYGFPAKRLSIEQQAERLKALCLVNQDTESVRAQEAHLPINPEPLPVLPISPDHVAQLPQPSGSSSENSILRLAIPEVRYSLSKYIYISHFLKSPRWAMKLPV